MSDELDEALTSVRAYLGRRPALPEPRRPVHDQGDPMPGSLARFPIRCAIRPHGSCDAPAVAAAVANLVVRPCGHLVEEAPLCAAHQAEWPVGRREQGLCPTCWAPASSVIDHYRPLHEGDLPDPEEEAHG